MSFNDLEILQEMPVRWRLNPRNSVGDLVHDIEEIRRIAQRLVNVDTEAKGTIIGYIRALESPLEKYTQHFVYFSTHMCIFGAVGELLKEHEGRHLTMLRDAMIEFINFLVKHPALNLKKCPSCGTKIPIDARFCGGCGIRL